MGTVAMVPRPQQILRIHGSRRYRYLDSQASVVELSTASREDGKKCGLEEGKGRALYRPGNGGCSLFNALSRSVSQLSIQSKRGLLIERSIIEF